MNFTSEELKDLVLEAQEKLFESIELIETFCQATNDTNAEMYLLAPLKIHASGQSEYVSHDLNLDDLMERVDERYGNEDEDEN